ncbi:MAG: NADH-quinone oxidoreductase subunit M, partial [Candidatus Omnitrophota bacterium]|nr:NADH-quinone oxidoreductase subunit M [Candidatus Omnitrophota bacterium]
MVLPLSLVILLAPIIGALIILLLPQQRAALIRRVSVAAMSVSLAGTVAALATYRPAVGGYQHEVFIPWIASLGIG